MPRHGAASVDVLLATVGATALVALAAAATLSAVPGLASSPPLAEAADLGREPAVVAGLAAVGLAALVATGLRRCGRAAAAARVLDAVRARAAGERDPEALRCAPDEAPDVAAWNRVVDELAAAGQEPAERRLTPGDPPASGERRLTGLCNALPDGLLLVGDGGRIRWANGAAAFLLGRRSEELVGLAAADVLASDEARAALASAAGDGHRCAPPVDVPRGDAPEDGVLRVVVRPIREAHAREAVVIVQDVTQQRVAAASRESFVAHVAHELRTPLTNIMLWAQTATERGGDDPRTTEQALNVITTESRRLERVVQDMLSISAIESGRQSLELVDVDLGMLVDDLRSDYGPQAAEKGLELTFDLPPKLPILRADRDKVSVTLHNLLGNAIKYTPAGGTVAVRVVADEGGVRIDVTDTGIGIRPEDLGRVFERFQRADDERLGGIVGTGLGLAIARDLARLHGGDVEAESELDEGSTFTLRLPVRAAA